MAAPAMTITSALIAGSRPITRPWSSNRRNVRLARMAASPIPVIESASPALNATISTEPEGDPVQRDGREEDDERGRAREEPAGDADGGQRAPAELRVAMAVVVMVVPVAVRVAVPKLAPTSTDAPTPITRSPETSPIHG